MRLAPGVQDYCWRLPGTTLPFSSALHPLPKEGSLPPRLPYLTLTAPQSGDKRRVGSVALSPRRLIFLQYFNCVAWPWNGGYVKWIYNHFTPFVCNLMGRGGKQLNFISNRSMLLQLQIEAWPWFANFCKFKGCSANSSVIAGIRPKSSFSLNVFHSGFRVHKSWELSSLRRHWCIYLESHYTHIDQELWHRDQHLQVLVLSHGFVIWLWGSYLCGRILLILKWVYYPWADTIGA